MLLGFEVYEKRNEARWREHELKNHGTKRKTFIKSFERGSPPGGLKVMLKGIRNMDFRNISTMLWVNAMKLLSV
jgi:hypothetical protein